MNTEKQKAKELHNAFYYNAIAEVMGKVVANNLAKQCAQRCVIEIELCISRIGNGSDGNSWFGDDIDWSIVNEELAKL
ncbi:MAG: hypothetical protein ACI9JN_001287 [Bacteroidia bacterium]|jgi:hypothetical protein